MNRIYLRFLVFLEAILAGFRLIFPAVVIDRSDIGDFGLFASAEQDFKRAELAGGGDI